MRFFLVRHGHTEANIKGQFQGQLDISLNDRGKEEILYLKEELKEYNFSQIYISPLRRAVETAEIIIEGLHDSSSMIEVESLKEIDFGLWEGLTANEIEGEFPYEYQSWLDDWQGYKIPGGESAQEMYQRIVDWLDKIRVEVDQGDDILVISHKGVILQIIANLLGLKLKDSWHFQVDPGSLSVVEVQQGFGILKRLNFKK